MITFIMILLSVVAQAFPSTFHIGRRPLLMSPIAPLLTANKEEVDYGKSDEGRLKISRREDSLFSIYYRIYNPEGNLTPVVVCHGGP